MCAMIRYPIFLIVFLLLPLTISEIWLRDNLWKYASYTNSAAIDQQLLEWNSRPTWDIVFIGDSEVRWGINPIAFESGLLAQGKQGLSAFNHGFDGFGGSWWSVLLPKVLRSAPNTHSVKYVAIGVQMAGHEAFWSDTSHTYLSGNCGDLQRPVLTSSFGIDLSLDEICRPGVGLLDKFVNEIVSPLWLIRYRSAIKSIILPGTSDRLTFNSAKNGEGFRGFEPHAPIAANLGNFESEFYRWRKQFEGHPEALAPLLPEVWDRMVGYGGYFDRMSDLVRSRGAEPIFFALPTNPLVIDYLHRRQDYLRNSDLLLNWAKNRGIIAIDLGIQDRKDADIYFSDMRHLSEIGAADFSSKLAVKIANHPRFLYKSDN